MKFFTNNSFGTAPFFLSWLEEAENGFFSDWSPGQKNTAPQTEYWHNEDGHFFEIELPGIDEKEIDISVRGRDLTLKAGRPEPSSPEGDTRNAPRKARSFTKHLQLPEGILSDKIEASFKNGILRLHIPPREKDKVQIVPIRSDKT